MAGFLTTERNPGKRHRGGQSRRSRSILSDARLTPHCRLLRFEPMEERTLLSVGMQPQYVIFNPMTKLAYAASSLIDDGGQGTAPLGSALPPTSAFNPAQLKQAYGIDQVKYNGVLQDGTGMTIAIIDAYDNPKFVSRNSNADVNQDPNFLASDLHQFDMQYNLPEPAGFFTKVNQTGGTTYPAGNTGWGTEIALDVEWVHAITPGAKIILVEASSTYDSDLLNGAAVWARDHSGAQVVTMSFGGMDSSLDLTEDSVFQSPADHGITWLASTGDSGAGRIPGLFAQRGGRRRHDLDCPGGSL